MFVLGFLASLFVCQENATWRGSIVGRRPNRVVY